MGDIHPAAAMVLFLVGVPLLILIVGAIGEDMLSRRGRASRKGGRVEGEEG